MSTKRHSNRIACFDSNTWGTAHLFLLDESHSPTDDYTVQVRGVPGPVYLGEGEEYECLVHLLPLRMVPHDQLVLSLGRHRHHLDLGIPSLKWFILR